MSLDVYAHIVIDPDADERLDCWRGVYAAEGSRGVWSPVRSEAGESDRDRASVAT